MKLRTKIAAIACALYALSGQGTVSAQSVTEGFDTFFGGYNSSWKWEVSLPEGWDYTGQPNYFESSADYFKAAKPSVLVDASNTSAYLITPALEGSFSFWLRNYTKTYQASVKAYACTFEDGKLSLGEEIGNKTLAKTTGNVPDWVQVDFEAPSPTRVALLISRAYMDDFTYTPAQEAQGPKLTIADCPSGSTFDFGGEPVSAGTVHSFTLVNKGNAELEITSIEISGDFNIVSGGEARTLASGEQTQIEVATPDHDAEGMLTISSNDAEGDYVVNLKSKYKAPAPVLEVDTKSLDFGTALAAVTKAIVVSNTGDAPMTVEISSDNDAFTVNPESLAVESGDSESVDVTFVFDGLDFGTYNGNLTLTPNEGEPVTISLTALAKDPDLWEEDFECGVMPDYWITTGWTVQKGSFFGNNGTYMAYAGNSASTTLTTPRLYAKEGQVLTFEVGGGTDTSDKLTVEYTHDLKEWIAIDGSPLTSEGVKTFVAPADGYYYLRFMGRYASLDNFSGFKLAPKAHDLSIVSQNIPQTGNQFVEYIAEVTVQEMMGIEETAKARMMIGGIKVAESETETIGAKEKHTFVLTFVPDMPFEGQNVEIEVEYSDETIVTDGVALTVAPAAVADEESEFDWETGTLPVLVFKYTTKPGWNVISTPFALTDEILRELFGKDYLIFEFYSHEDDYMYFRETSMFAAGYPYAVLAPNALDETVELVLQDIRIEKTEGQSDQYGGVKFQASLNPMHEGDLSNYYTLTPRTEEVMTYDSSIKDPVLTACDEETALPAFRGYVDLGEFAGKVPTLRFYKKDGMTTGVDALLPGLTLPDGIYNLDGVKVSDPTVPGIYIINGKKRIIK